MIFGDRYGPVVECVPNFAVSSPDLLPVVSAAGWRLLDSSFDSSHARAVVTVGGSVEGVGGSAFSMVAAAVSSLSLVGHAGVHPRVGVADVVPFAPVGVGALALDACAGLASSLAERVWAELHVPVYLYGPAFGGVRLADIRRSVLAGTPLPPAVGGPAPHPTAGFCCVGARPALVAYNLVLNGVDLLSARRLAGLLRERSGSGLGMPGVQALAFEVAAGVQLSMNLVDLAVATPGRVRAEVEGRVAGLGGSVAGDEVVGLCPAAACEPWTPALAGLVLECRLAAAAARRGAASARAHATEAGGGGARRAELGALAGKLDEAAERLAGITGPDEFLPAAEQSAALLRVLAAARLLEAEPAAMLQQAALGLLAAAPAHSGTRFDERASALRRWLADPPPVSA